MRVALAAIAAFGLSMPAYAGPILAPVPVANFITLGGLDWAWASPCAFSGSSCGIADMTFQASQGWRIPTLAEFLARPKVADFGTSNNFKCASAWFSPDYTHCDYSDPGNDSGSVNSAGQPTGFLFDFGYHISHVGDQMNYDTWLVRDPDFNPVPEPASWMMMLVGFGMAGYAMRRRHKLDPASHAMPDRLPGIVIGTPQAIVSIMRLPSSMRATSPSRLGQIFLSISARGGGRLNPIHSAQSAMSSGCKR